MEAASVDWFLLAAKSSAGQAYPSRSGRGTEVANKKNGVNEKKEKKKKKDSQIDFTRITFMRSYFL